MMIYFLPVLIILLLIYCLIKNIPAYDHFVSGSSKAVDLVLSIFPYLIAIFVFVELMNASGVSEYLCKICAPFLDFVGIPKELSELIILRPFSGNGSLAIVKNIYQEFGPDSYIGRCASVVVGASDTVFYVTAIYFSTTKVKKLRYAIPVCLIASMVGSIMACALVRWFW